MAYFKKKGDANKYSFVDKDCLGRKCFHADLYNGRPCCMNRAYRGCPEGPYGEHIESCGDCGGSGSLVNDGPFSPCSDCAGTGRIIHIGMPIPDSLIAKERKAEGWKWLA